MKSKITPLFIAMDGTVRSCSVFIDFDQSAEVMADGFCIHDKYQMIEVGNVSISGACSLSEIEAIFSQNCTDENHTMFLGFTQLMVEEIIRIKGFKDNRK
jgi:hypothetical protein